MPAFRILLILLQAIGVGSERWCAAEGRGVEAMD